MSAKPEPFEIMGGPLDGFVFNPDKALAVMFRMAEEAGYGICTSSDTGTLFEAYPGMEDAAADYLQTLLG